MTMRRTCGWGGRGGCTKRGVPWLCAEHSAIIGGVAGQLKQDAAKDLKRGGISSWSTVERAQCVTPRCARFASRGELYCGRHGVKVASRV